jgi:CDP-diacylglycerol--serine O-phosphatidyltransferase
MKQIPNFFTLINLIFGCLAIIVTLQNGITIVAGNYGAQLVDIPEKIWLASLFIALAAVIDFFDGFIARLLHAFSPMGKQLDSLADVVSFGVAPGLILYQFLRLSFAQQENGIDVSIVWLLPALLVPCAAAYRLAKFNVDDTQQYGFKGVPTPAVGLFIASFPLIYWFGNNGIASSLLLNKWVLYAVIATVSYLMVCNLPMMSLKFTQFHIKKYAYHLLLALVALVSALFLKWIAVPVTFIAYVLLSLLHKNKQ